MTTVPRAIAVLRLSKSTKSVLAFAKSVVTAITDNAALPSPTPPIAQLQSDVDALDTAEAAVLSRTKGAVETRDVKLATVRSDLEHLLAYVQQVANANASTAQAIIEGAGMSVRVAAVRNKADLEAQAGPVSGSVKLVAKAVAHRAAYEWQYSTDQKTWTGVPGTIQAKTDITGLTPATAYFFRFRGVTRTGEGNWSQVVSLLVA
jgi:hypothetical protein